MPTAGINFVPDNVVHVYCDTESDTGTIKLHTPVGMIDIGVSFNW